MREPEPVVLWQLGEGSKASLGRDKSAECVELSLQLHAGDGALVTLTVQQGGQSATDQLLLVLGKQTLQARSADINTSDNIYHGNDNQTGDCGRDCHRHLYYSK